MWITEYETDYVQYVKDKQIKTALQKLDKIKQVFQVNGSEVEYVVALPFRALNKMSVNALLNE